MIEMRIPFGTITVTERSRQLIEECLDKKRISSGRLVRTFEERFAARIGAHEAVAVSSGTDADTLALAVLYDLGARRGDEVIVPALSFVATGNAVLHAGFRPVFVDIDRETLNLDVNRIEALINPRTRAIMPVHLMGKPADLDPLKDIAHRHKLLVVEDAAEAHGALYKGRHVGTIGDLGAFSLYVAHIISTGEGGIVTTGNPQFAELLRSLRAHGRACKCRQCVSNVTSGYCAKRFEDLERGDIRFHFERIGYSSKMNELEAALGLGTIDLFEEIVERRRSHLFLMMQGFAEFEEFFSTFKEEPHERIGPHAFPFILRPDAPFERGELLRHLEENGIDARTLFASIPTQCGGYEFLGHQTGEFPQAEYAGRNGLHVGVHQDIQPDDIAWFLETVRRFIKKR
jgi:dTDP-4-amino-4,6-dideoxygalactose transaminase